MTIPATVQKAWKAALKARSNAYAPYSRFKVGAAVKVKGQKDLVTGCNVENASYGATICAERAALTQAVARYGQHPLEFVVVATDEDKATVPCALCLQVIAEFADDTTPIYLANTRGVLHKLVLQDLLPQPFRSFRVKK